MPYKTSTLITNSYYLSGIVSRDFQSVIGRQMTDGLDLLNEQLAEEGINGTLIPYYKEFTFDAVPAQEKYSIPGLVEAETLTFNIGTVRYEMDYKGRYKYFGTPRTDNIQSLPYEWRIERVLNGAELYIYFLPNTDYPMKLWGKFKLDELTTVNDDLLLVYDRYYLKYLRYSLAKEICSFNLVGLPLEAKQELKSLEQKLVNVSGMDLSVKKRSSFQSSDQINYGYANLGTGWRPS